jgi:glyoxylase-like metal-dependent hydrolase (beta-lactamase superfamily II)
MVEIVSGLHHIPGVVANVFLVADEEGLTLIDSGLPRSHRKILAYLAGIGRRPAEVKRIVITHADLDHYGGLAAVVKASGAQVLAQEDEAQAIAAGAMSRPLKLKGFQHWLFSLSTYVYKAEPVHVDRTLSAGEILPVLGGLEVLATPGHTPGHISLWAPARGVLFAGDSLRADKSGLHPSRGINTWDEDLALESARAQARLAPAVVCAGHGPVVREPGERDFTGVSLE